MPKLPGKLKESPVETLQKLPELHADVAASIIASEGTIKPSLAGQSMNLTPSEVKNFQAAQDLIRRDEIKRDSRKKDIRINELSLEHTAMKKQLAFAHAEIVKLTLKIQENELQKEEIVLRDQIATIKQEINSEKQSSYFVEINKAIKSRMGIDDETGIMIDTDSWEVIIDEM